MFYLDFYYQVFKLTDLYANQNIEVLLPDIVNLLKTALRDASSEAKRISRLCYWALHEISPTHCRALYSSLDSTQQKLITEEQSSFETLTQNGSIFFTPGWFCCLLMKKYFYVVSFLLFVSYLQFFLHSEEIRWIER